MERITILLNYVAKWPQLFIRGQNGGISGHFLSCSSVAFRMFVADMLK